MFNLMLQAHLLKHLLSVVLCCVLKLLQIFGTHWNFPKSSVLTGASLWPTEEVGVWRYLADHYWWLLSSPLLQSMVQSIIRLDGSICWGGVRAGGMRRGRRGDSVDCARNRKQPSCTITHSLLENLHFTFHSVHSTIALSCARLHCTRK